MNTDGVFKYPDYICIHILLLQCVPDWQLCMLKIGSSSVIKQFDSFYEKLSWKPTHKKKHIDFLGLTGSRRSDSDLFRKLLEWCTIALDKTGRLSTKADRLSPGA